MLLLARGALTGLCRGRILRARGVRSRGEPAQIWRGHHGRADAGAASLDVTGIQDLHGRDVQVSGNTDTGIARIDRSGRRDQIDIARWYAGHGIQYADATTCRQTSQIGLDIAALGIDQNTRGRRRLHGLRGCARGDVAGLGEDDLAAAAESEDTRRSDDDARLGVN